MLEELIKTIDEFENFCRTNGIIDADPNANNIQLVLFGDGSCSIHSDDERLLNGQSFFHPSEAISAMNKEMGKQ